MECGDGLVRTGGQAKAHGLPLAYGELPHEHVAFIGCHDNQTIFDQITEKAALTVTAEERMRMCVMCLSLIALSQGVPFFHAGETCGVWPAASMCCACKWWCSGTVPDQHRNELHSQMRSLV